MTETPGELKRVRRTVVPVEIERPATRVIDAAVAVHYALGPGYAESVYENALARELTDRGVAFQRQTPFRVTYKGEVVGEGRIDILVDGKLVVELKAVEQALPVHKAQVVAYLRALNLPLGLLLNFNVPLLKSGIHRVIN